MDAKFDPTLPTHKIIKIIPPSGLGRTWLFSQPKRINAAEILRLHGIDPGPTKWRKASRSVLAVWRRSSYPRLLAMYVRDLPNDYNILLIKSNSLTIINKDTTRWLPLVGTLSLISRPRDSKGRYIRGFVKDRMI